MAIATVDSRARLKARRAPYWHKLSTGKHIGYRKMANQSAGTWVAQAYDQTTRKQTRRSLGAFDDLPASKRFDAAVSAAREWFDHLDTGGGTKVVTVRDACADYVDAVQRDRPETARDAQARFNRWVLSHRVADVPLHKLSERDVRAWRTWITESGSRAGSVAGSQEAVKRSPSSINRDMTALRAALNHAQRSRTVTSDMAWRFALAPIKNADGRRHLYLDITQRRALISQASADLAVLLTALSLVPIRPGALASLNVADFDRQLGVLRVGKDKAGGDRKISLPKASATFFAGQCRNKTSLAPLISRADGKRWNKDAWKKPLKLAAEAASLSTATTAYTLRHSVITDLVVHGLDLLTVAQLAGTGVAMIERHYGHHRADRASAALAGLTL